MGSLDGHDLVILVVVKSEAGIVMVSSQVQLVHPELHKSALLQSTLSFFFSVFFYLRPRSIHSRILFLSLFSPQIQRQAPCEPDRSADPACCRGCLQSQRKRLSFRLEPGWPDLPSMPYVQPNSLDQTRLKVEKHPRLLEGVI